MRNSIREEYFEWLFEIVCAGRYSERISYRKLLAHLHEAEFKALLAMDRNRAEDGMDLRYRFILDRHYDHMYREVMRYLDGPCSVLEMMVALAIRCEENIMDDPSMGDRTGQWFWGMIVNLGLGGMRDTVYDSRLVSDAINRLIFRTYEPNGRGGLFTVRNCDRDLRGVEIWFQLCWYLDNFAN